ncbi:MAG: N-acetylmuramoyl-L-alanine amidase CwlD [Peptococcaceae bacterium]|nr:N-acetylmuramoyl-L-alanine amidase CwlD [Peptococcaceae bacterium]
MFFFLSYKELRKRYLPWLSVMLCAALGLSAFSAWREIPGEEAVAAMSWAIAGRTIILDPGHGGEDPGKVGVSGSFEKDINLQVAIKVRSLLAQGGANVVMTREQDNALCEDRETLRERKREDLNRRLALAKEEDAGMYVTIHCNSFPKSSSSGAQVFYAPQAPGSRELAESLQQSLRETLGNTRRLPKEDQETFIMRNAEIPTVNVEMGFLSNAKEEELLLNPAYQDKVAWAIYSGIVYYLAGQQ